MASAADGWKVCGNCKERKSVSEFSADVFARDRLAFWCKICFCTYSAAYRKGHPAYQKAYRQTEGGKGTIRRYEQSDRGKAVRQQANHRHRARKAGCVGSHTITEFFELCEEYDFRCLRCGEVFPFEDLTEDHIIPVGPGVSDRIDNIQPLCRPCNASKGRQGADYRRKEVHDNTKLVVVAPIGPSIELGPNPLRRAWNGNRICSTEDRGRKTE